MASKMELQKVTKSWLALNLKMDRRTIDKRLSDVKPCEMSGRVEKYYLWDVLRPLANPDAELGGTHEDLTAARTRKETAAAIKLERENAIKAGEIADMADVIEGWQDLVGAFRAKMMSLPAQLGNRCANMDRGKVEDEARKLTWAALDELSREFEK